MKSVQSSLDSTKNTVISAPDAGNKVIKNVAQGIQTTSWMFDKFSNLLDELASAFDELQNIGSDIQSEDISTTTDVTAVSERDFPAASEVAQSIYSQHLLLSPGQAGRHLGQKKRAEEVSDNSESATNDEDPAVDAVDPQPAESNEDGGVDNGVSSVCIATTVQGSTSCTDTSEAGEVSEENIEELPLFSDASGAEQDQKASMSLNSETQEGMEQNELESSTDQQLAHDSIQSAQQSPLGSSDEVKIEESNPHKIEEVCDRANTNNELEHEDSSSSTVLHRNNAGGEMSPSQVRQQVAMQQASNASFQGAVKSAQSAVAQTVESVREMIKELGSVSNATAVTKNFGQVTASLATQIGAENKETHSTKNHAPLTRGQIIRTLERVENTLKEIIKSKDGKSISLRLDPPSLGSLKIDVSYREGNLHARIVPESSQVALALRERAHELQSILRRVGIDATQVSVTIANPSSSGQEMPNHSGNLFLGEHAYRDGDGGSQEKESFSKDSQKGFKNGKDGGVKSQAKGNELDHWVA